MSIKHDKKLDNDIDLKKQAEYYDEADIEEAFDLSKAVRQKAKIKRVNLLLPFNMYLEAMELGQETGVGYQNTLKMAINIGLKKLKEPLKNN